MSKMWSCGIYITDHKKIKENQKMEVYTEKTGWVRVIRDDKKHLGMWLSVPGYTFYFAKYQEIITVKRLDYE